MARGSRVCTVTFAELCRVAAQRACEALVKALRIPSDWAMRTAAPRSSLPRVRSFCSSGPSRVPSLLLCLALASTATVAPAQTTKPAYSRLDFGNAYRIDRELRWPNAADGNVDGDLAYKAFPKEVLARHKTIRVSGVRVSYTVDKSYRGSFPAFPTFPVIAFYPLVEAKVGGSTYDVPDLGRKAARTIPAPFQQALRTGISAYEIRFDPSAVDPRFRVPIDLPARDSKGNLQGWAVALMAPPGQKQGDGKANFACVQSFGEVHRASARRSYSGMYDAKAKRFVPFGTSAISNIGELAIELLLDAPTLQLYSSAAGGLRNDPTNRETYKGPGAYYSGLASSVVPAWFGLYAQWEGHDLDGTVALPFVMGAGSTQPKSALTIDLAVMLNDPALIFGRTMFLDAGLAGPFAQYKKNGVAGHASDQSGVFVTPRLAFPRNAALAGVRLWMQVLVVNTSLRFPAASNLVLLEL